jgi:hypothetical protein
MNIKVLPLEPWMKFTSTVCKSAVDQAQEISPVFKREGYYLYGDKCWFETPEGTAYLHEKNNFTFTLEVLEAEKYNHRQIKL